MRPLLALVLLLPAALPLGADEPDSGAAKKAAHEYLVEVNCEPGDAEALTTMLRAALALRDDDSAVALFLDLAAVAVAVPGCEAQGVDLRRETDKLFEKLQTAGVVVLVCPHCAQQFGLPVKSLRPGLRLTTKLELDAWRTRAEKILEFRRPAAPQPKVEPAVVECRAG